MNNIICERRIYNFSSDTHTHEYGQYINAHFAEKIDLKKLADIEHYNVSYYTEWFKNTMNISPIEYIQNLRIKKAKELLLNTNLPILQMVGYEHNSSFTKVFKQLEKISPVDFRKNI